MENKELVKQEKNEFQEYITSKIEDEAPSKGQTFGGIGLGIGYLFIFSTILAIVWAIFNQDLLNPEYDSTLESSIIQIIAGVITVVATGFIIGKGKVLKILKGFNLKNLGIAATFVALAFAASILVGYLERALFGDGEISSSNQESVENMILNYKFVGFIMVAIIAPFVEEIIFRYFVFRGSQKAWGTVAAFIITVVSFAGIHYLNSIMAGTLLEDLKSVLSYLVPSFLMTFLYFKNKNLATPIMFHMLFNGIQFVLMIASASADFGDGGSSISGVTQALINLLG